MTVCHACSECEEEYVNSALAVTQICGSQTANRDLNELIPKLPIMCLRNSVYLLVENKVRLIKADGSLEKQAIMRRSSALCH